MEERLLTPLHNDKREHLDSNENPGDDARPTDAQVLDWLNSAWLEDWLRLARMNHACKGN